MVMKDVRYFHEKKSQYDILTADEMRAIADYKIDLPHYPKGKNEEYRALYYLLILTGCRIGEALQLSWNNTHTDFIVFEDTKNGEDRVVPIPDKLSRLIHALPRRAERVFPMENASVGDNLRTRVKRLGIKKRVFIHLFRHSFITLMLESGVDPITIAYIVGHRDVNSTMRYNQARLEHYRNAMMLHPILKDTLTIEGVEKQVHDYISSLLKGTKYTYLLRKSATGLAISVK